MMRNEARQVGAHAVINVQMGETVLGASASGIAIGFKDYNEAIRLLKETGAVFF